jgi:hypothetical protein
MAHYQEAIRPDPQNVPCRAIRRRDSIPKRSGGRMSTEDRRKGAMDLLGALFLAMCVFLPVFLWWIGVIK